MKTAISFYEKNGHQKILEVEKNRLPQLMSAEPVSGSCVYWVRNVRMMDRGIK